MVELAVVVIASETEMMILDETERHILEAIPSVGVAHFDGVVYRAMGVIARRWPCDDHNVTSLELVERYTFVLGLGPVGGTVIT